MIRSPLTQLVFASVLLAATVEVSASSASPDREIVTLSGTTSFTATEVSSTVVRFPQPVDFHDDFDAEFGGDGRVMGFILRKTGRYDDEARRPVIVNVNIGQCSKPGCPSRRQPTFMVCFCDSTILFGTWDLYVVADAVPVTVTLSLRGSDGRARYLVDNPTPSEITVPGTRVEEQASRVLYSVGDFTKLEEPDFGMVGLWVEGEPYAATAVGDCMYSAGSVMPPRELAFLPGCPTGRGDTYLHHYPTSGRASVTLTSAWICCPRGLGAWYSSASSVKRYGSVALWIEL